jgi:protein gp37
MSTNTHIEWTDATWNTLSGCTRISEGCLNCYIERTPPFRMAHRRFDSPAIGGKTGIILHENRLDLPLHWRNPRRVFVNSLADLFHDDVPTEHIAKVFATMARAERHTFQVLTKRPARMRSLLADGGFRLMEATSDEATAQALYDAPWPLPNVWIGTSVESQKWADVRVPQLLRTEAAVRFLSCEPLLGPIKLASTDGIDWVIVGGESGPGARPMHPAWARQLRDQCQTAGTAFFLKQHGEWAERATLTPEDRIDVWNDKRVTYVHPADGRTQPHGAWGMHDHLEGWAVVQRVGKHAAGRELDGRTWDEMPRTLATATTGSEGRP